MTPQDDDAGQTTIESPPREQPQVAYPKIPRLLASVLSFFLLGSGHFLLGRFRRGIMWVVISMALLLSTPLTTVFGVWAGSLLAKLAAVVDVLLVNRRQTSWKQVLVGLAALFVFTGVWNLVVRTYYLQAFQIPTGAMAQTLLPGDYLMVNNAAYRFGPPRAGDIIVFPYPEDPSKDFIKRCVAVGGQTAEIREKQLYVDGRLREEPYVSHVDSRVLSREVTPRDSFGPYQVPAGHIFMLGDNRDNSHDSRFWGPLPVRLVKGRAMFLYWSWDAEQHRPRLERVGRSLRSR